MQSSVWDHCLDTLRSDLTEQQFNTWIKPLLVIEDEEGPSLTLLAPNKFVVNWVQKNYLEQIVILPNGFLFFPKKIKHLKNFVMVFFKNKIRSDFNFSSGVICCFGDAEFFPMDWRGRKKFPKSPGLTATYTWSSWRP